MAQTENKQLRIRLLEAKRELYFSQINSIFQLSSKRDEKSRYAFLSQARHLDRVREEYASIIDELNTIHLELNPEYAVNYNPLTSFDDLYYFIKETMFRIERTSQGPCENKSPTPNTIKIPKIELPSFDGEIINFPFFYETFKRLIHDNDNLCDSERVHYLTTHLIGKAKSSFAGIPPAAENYKVIWDNLLEKYKDDRALATTYLNKLFSLKPIGTLSSATSMNLEKFIDTYSATIAALKQLKLANLSDFIFVHWGLKLVDSDTAKSYESSIRGTAQIPNYEDFIKFVREQSKILHRTSATHSFISQPTTNRPAISNRASPRTFISTEKNQHISGKKCKLCKDNHTHLYVCKLFLNLSPLDKFKFIKENRYCINCLSTQHTSFYCNSNTLCKKCNARHHSLLHFNKVESSLPSTSTVAVNHTTDVDNAMDNESEICDIINSLGFDEEPESPSNESSLYDPENETYCTLSSTRSDTKPVTQVLATAVVIARGRNGKDVNVRCLLDPGSQQHYITAKCCSKLGLKIEYQSTVTVKGIGGTSQNVKGVTNVTIRSRFNDSKFNLKALILNQITSNLPTCQIDTTLIEYLNEVSMADDNWNIPSEIDLLIGVSLFAELLKTGRIIGIPGHPGALETLLGYVVVGDAPVSTQHQSFTSVSCHTITSTDIEALVRKMWELDEIDPKHIVSEDDKICEKIYKDTVTRDSNGRYEVALPFKQSAELLGNSYECAKRRFSYLERKFNTQPTLRAAYDDVIRDYLKQGYLSLINTDAHMSNQHYYIPHHAVLRDDKLTTKVRPVLDASAKTSSGYSLNDLLYSGPNLQRDLFTILLNMRLFPVAISADIKQMYLRIRVRSQDRKFQRILYKSEKIEQQNEPVITFESNTTENNVSTYEFNCVAFGLKCSPFLALRTVSQLVQDEGHRFPFAEEIVQRDLYMDDVCSSIFNTEQAIKASFDLIELFKAGGFDLVKWASNSNNVLNNIPPEYHLPNNVEFEESTLKVLGLCWNPGDDQFTFKVTTDDRPCTKRNILSCVARLFDVLGLVAPVILYAKLLIKELWEGKIDWDEPPPQRVIKLWNQFKLELPEITKLRFHRHIGVIQYCKVTLLGFADASEKAYGACIYIKIITKNKLSSISLVCSKAKVAPLKTISLARLELCATLLLSKLIKKTIETYNPRYPIEDILAFSDSTVTLNWIHSSPHRWHTFVANRVSKIQDNLPSKHFFHIKGKDNPSDCLSRGLTPAQLINHPLWFSGPPWALSNKSDWPIKPFVPSESSNIPESKVVSLPVTESSTSEPFLCCLSRKFSSWPAFLNVVCYIFKFARKITAGPITASDLEFVELEVVKQIQSKHFSEDIKKINKNNNYCCSATLKSLCPFIKDGILRVGGRLSNSDEDFEFKHPILLPSKEYIVTMLIQFYHRKYLHTGTGLLTSILRAKYWIISARRAIKSIISKCNTCFKYKPKPGTPLMADLPEPRVKIGTKAFIHTGCDYAGPISVTPYRGRGIKSRKAYICLFTCLTTRAVHIELASDLSTSCFLAAMKRFLSRRGPVHCIYSDNGTNFVGAHSYLRELYSFLRNEYNPTLERELPLHRISWKFIPPSAPHFGGCWESTIKCVKSHLVKVIGNQILTFEEIQTVLAQIESLLNSRPLTLLSSDPSDPVALTTSHFLHTTPLEALPSYEISDSVPHLLNRYELLDKIVQSFWVRWRKEYLHNLQIRQKWNVPSPPIKEGMIVIVMQDNLPPLAWPLGIVIGTFKGRDDVVRVATVKTKSGTYRRPVVKLCPLPSQ